MQTDDMIESRKSPEYTIDLAVETLLGKMLAGSITNAETAEYNQLLVQRSRMMRGRACYKHVRSKRHAA
jgi:hypothetical protein